MEKWNSAAQCGVRGGREERKDCWGEKGTIGLKGWSEDKQYERRARYVMEDGVNMNRGGERSGPVLSVESNKEGRTAGEEGTMGWKGGARISSV